MVGTMEKQYPKSIWRLLITPPASGPWNMALDEAILEAVGRGEAPPTLRLYAWEPPCLSLGYTQPLADVDLIRLKERGWDLVRRPTGGRAILHTDELTYAVIGPLHEPRLSGSVLESYRRLSEALLAALHLSGIPAEARPNPSPTSPSTTRQDQHEGPVCFEVPSNYEITAGGKKLIGSAQARRKEGVLQHGSLPLCGDLTRITEVLSFPDDTARSMAAKRLLDRASTVEMLLGKPQDWTSTAQAFVAGFRQVLDLDFEQAEVSESEARRASELVREKFENQEWTGRL